MRILYCIYTAIAYPYNPITIESGGYNYVITCADTSRQLKYEMKGDLRNDYATYYITRELQPIRVYVLPAVINTHIVSV